MKLKILRNLGGDWPRLTEGQVVETGKGIDREVAAELVKHAWLAEVVEPDAPPEPEAKPAEIKAIPPQVEKPIEGRTKAAQK